MNRRFHTNYTPNPLELSRNTTPEVMKFEVYDDILTEKSAYDKPRQNFITPVLK